MFWIWFVVAVAFLFIEMMTTDLVSIWFAASALVMGIVAAIFEELHLGWQIGIFVVLSAALFFATRKLVKKFFKRNKEQETNLELVVGHNAVVTGEVDNLLEKCYYLCAITHDSPTVTFVLFFIYMIFILRGALSAQKECRKLSR